MLRTGTATFLQHSVSGPWKADWDVEGLVNGKLAWRVFRPWRLVSIAFMTVAPKEGRNFGTHLMWSQGMLGGERTCLVLNSVCSWTFFCETPAAFCFLTAPRPWAFLLPCRGKRRYYVLVSYHLIVFPFHLSTWSFFHSISMLRFLTTTHNYAIFFSLLLTCNFVSQMFIRSLSSTVFF